MPGVRSHVGCQALQTPSGGRFVAKKVPKSPLYVQHSSRPANCKAMHLHRQGRHAGLGMPAVASATARASGSREGQAVDVLLEALKGSERGLQSSGEDKKCIEGAISALQEIGRDQVTLEGPIDATWKLLWTTEKETLFILKNAKLFGTEAGDVFQVIDTPNSRLQNVITFKNGASFVVDSSLEAAGEQRLAFKFTAARLNLPSRTWRIPPFGKGWFDTVYLEGRIRVAKDIRGDTLVVERAGPPRVFP